MLSKIWIINLCLAGLVAFLGFNAVREWSGRETAIPELVPAPSVDAPKHLPPKQMGISRDVPPKEDFNVVAEKNLFASEREEIKEEVKPPPPPPAPQKQAQKESELAAMNFTLYGIIISSSYKGALLAVSEEQNSKRRPQPSQSQQGDPQWYAPGEGEGEWKVTSIEKDKVVVSVGGAAKDVRLYDKEKPKQRAVLAGKTQGPTVVTIATQAAAASQPTVVGEKGSAKEPESGTTEQVRAEERRIVETKKQEGTSTSRIGTSLSTRTAREGSGLGESTSTYPPSRLPQFMRKR